MEATSIRWLLMEPCLSEIYTVLVKGVMNMTMDTDEERRTKRVKACAVILVNRMKWQKSTMTYGELADLMSGICETHILADRLGDDLARILDCCKAEELPALSSMVVNKETGKPGENFYNYYREIHPEKATLSNEEILAEEQPACLSCTDWQRLYDHLHIGIPAPKMK